MAPGGAILRRRWWEWEPLFPIVSDDTALLVIDMQNAFLEEGAPLRVPMACGQVSQIQGLCDACRSLDVPVVFSAFYVDAMATPRFYWNRACERGLDLLGSDYLAINHPETQIDARLGPLPGDHLIYKVGYDCFAYTGLDNLLRQMERRTLIMCGTVVNWCVDSTLRRAFHLGYRCCVVADAVSGYDHAGLSGEQWVSSELDFFAEALGRVEDSGSIIQTLHLGEPSTSGK